MRVYGKPWSQAWIEVPCLLLTHLRGYPPPDDSMEAPATGSIYRGQLGELPAISLRECK